MKYIILFLIVLSLEAKTNCNLVVLKKLNSTTGTKSLSLSIDGDLTVCTDITIKDGGLLKEDKNGTLIQYIKGVDK